ncbi:hypothetical protein CFC21_053001 [Triticum aestivum]|uniref:Uncharacterized protein n=3 Tax=Triticum TaxID=4564 RepID=A0A9R0SDZ9_TRITD|nr:hypothetical protein CFC21_053001 [Triticum aestivum]VAH93615.1 unnamed protein product [Triticum turgidum subsp. durum]
MARELCASQLDVQERERKRIGWGQERQKQSNPTPGHTIMTMFDLDPLMTGAISLLIGYENVEQEDDSDASSDDEAIQNPNIILSKEDVYKRAQDNGYEEDEGAASTYLLSQKGHKKKHIMQQRINGLGPYETDVSYASVIAKVRVYVDDHYFCDTHERDMVYIEYYSNSESMMAPTSSCSSRR